MRVMTLPVSEPDRRRLPARVWLRLAINGLMSDPVSALRGLWWTMRRYRVRGRNLLFAAVRYSPGYYRLWQEIAERPMLASLAQGPAGPRIAFVRIPPVAEVATRVQESACAADQWWVGVDPNAGATMQDIARQVCASEPDAWIVPVTAGDQMSSVLPQALGHAIVAAGDAEIVYWDHDDLVAGNRTSPWLKPDWDDLLFLAHDYLSGSCAFRAASLARLASVDQLAINEQGLSALSILMAGRTASGEAPPPLHLPLVLSHRVRGNGDFVLANRQAALDKFWPEHVQLQQVASHAGAVEAMFPSPVVWPKVSIIIPTRDRVDLLRMCTSGLARTVYPGAIETIIVDNGSAEAETQAFFAKLSGNGGKVISAPGEFNFSALNNLAAAQASGDYLLLLNNDVDVLDEAWLETMMRHALRNNRIGAVGALLLYPSGKVQHAGVAIGLGQAAGHVYRGIEPEETGHRAMHRTTRKVSAVTAACLLVRRQVYHEVGGLDEVAFKVAFNDVDFCLKLRRAGYENVFVAAARLVHHESESRGDDMDAANLPRFRKELTELQERWNTAGALDPYHHPLFSPSSTDAVLAL